jgi:hypothetical protein
MMKKNIDLMKTENKQLAEKAKLTAQYLKEDKADLEAAAKEAGVEFTIDVNTGNITNYTDEMTRLFNERQALLSSFGEEMNED